MKKSLIAVAILSTAAMSFAAPTVYEPFNYPVAASAPSNLSTQSGGVWNALLGKNVTVEPQVVSGNLSYPGLGNSIGNHVQVQNSSSGSSRLDLPTAVASGTLYYSMIFQGSDATSESSAVNGSFLAGFNNSTGAGTSITSGGATLTIRQDSTTTSDFDLGIGVSAAAATRNWTGPFSASDTLFLVGSYTFNPGSDDDVANLYVFNGSAIPASLPATPDATSTGSDIGTGQIQSFFLRDNSIEPPTMDVDELRIGTSWADVTTAVPEPASLSLLGLGAIGLLARRRRSA